MISRYPFNESHEIVSCLTGKELLQGLNEETKYDIVFMDIQLGDENGIEVATIIKQLYPETLLIYGSSYDNYFRDLASAEPFLFLPKPVTVSDVHKALDKAVERIEATVRKYYYFSCNGEQKKVDLNRVLYFESAYKKVTVKTNIDEYEFWGKLSEVCSDVRQLHPYFVQINKSVIINILLCDTLGKTEVKIGSETFNVTANYEPDYREKKLAFVRGRIPE